MHGEATGHEIIFAAPVTILDPSFSRKKTHAFSDFDANHCRWHLLSELEIEGVRCFRRGYRTDCAFAAL